MAKFEDFETAKSIPDARSAEVFCGKAGIEFHPVVCDVFEASTDEKKCRHVSKTQREQREAAYEALKPKAEAINGDH